MIDLSDLGVTWVKASGWIPEQLSQVSPKSDYFFSLLGDFVLGVALIVSGVSIFLSVDLSDLGVTWVKASGWIPEQLSQVSPKSDHFFSLLNGFV